MDRPRTPATLWPGAFALAGVALALAWGGPALAGRLRDLGAACFSGALAAPVAGERAAGLLLGALAALLAAAAVALALGAALRRRLLGGPGRGARGDAGAGALLIVPLALLVSPALFALLERTASGPGEARSALGLVALAGLGAAALAGAVELVRERR